MGGGRQHLFEVVQHQQLAPLAQGLHQALEPAAAAHVQEVEGVSEGAEDLCGLADGSEISEGDPVSKAIGTSGERSGCGERQAGLAHTCGASQREQPHILCGQQLSDERQFIGSTHQRGRRGCGEESKRDEGVARGRRPLASAHLLGAHPRPRRRLELGSRVSFQP